jgi:hypothetical protein
LSDPNVDRICKRFQERAQRGLLKYGVTTERKDLTANQWLVHLQEELMDAVVYIERLKQEVALLELSIMDQELFKESYVQTDTN